MLIPQITQVLAVIYFVPLILVSAGDLTGLDISRIRAVPEEAWALPAWPSVLWAMGAVVLGAWLAKRLCWPQPLMLGPLRGIALLQISGLTDLSIPGQALVTEIPPAAIFLAFAPGGLPEMVLIAATLNADPAFVVVHHVVRFLIIAIALPWVAGRVATPQS